MKFLTPPSGFKRLFYDIEVSPDIGFFWGSGSKIFISPDNIIKERAVICICWKWEGLDEVNSLEWSDWDDSNMLEMFMDIALQADELVAHNGDNFDEKWIRTRCLLHGIEMPPKLVSFDTLKAARKHFRFNSNKLDYIAKLLGVGQKISTSFDMWKDICLGTESASDAMDAMVEYCKMDVLVLEQVYKKLIQYSEPKTNVGAHEGFGRYSCPRCGSDDISHWQVRSTKAGMKKHSMKCRSCKGFYQISNRVYLDFLEDKQKEERYRAENS